MLQALDIISIQIQTYIGDKRVRRADRVAEITDIDPTTKKIRTTDIFVWNPETDTFERAGDSLVLDEIRQRKGWTQRELQEELKNRQSVLDYLLQKGIKDHKEITKLIEFYYINSEELLKKGPLRCYGRD
jgi:flagellar protein FlaI